MVNTTTLVLLAVSLAVSSWAFASHTTIQTSTAVQTKALSTSSLDTLSKIVVQRQESPTLPPTTWTGSTTGGLEDAVGPSYDTTCTEIPQPELYPPPTTTSTVQNGAFSPNPPLPSGVITSEITTPCTSDLSKTDFSPTFLPTSTTSHSRSKSTQPTKSTTDILPAIFESILSEIKTEIQPGTTIVTTKVRTGKSDDRLTRTSKSTFVTCYGGNVDCLTVKN